jgi:hypothetical protein
MTPRFKGRSVLVQPSQQKEIGAGNNLLHVHVCLQRLNFGNLRSVGRMVWASYRPVFRERGPDRDRCVVMMPVLRLSYKKKGYAPLPLLCSIHMADTVEAIFETVHQKHFYWQLTQ